MKMLEKLKIKRKENTPEKTNKGDVGNVEK